jgi:hypothetical protein
MHTLRILGPAHIWSEPVGEVQRTLQALPRKAMSLGGSWNLFEGELLEAFGHDIDMLEEISGEL